MFKDNSHENKKQLNINYKEVLSESKKKCEKTIA